MNLRHKSTIDESRSIKDLITRPTGVRKMKLRGNGVMLQFMAAAEDTIVIQWLKLLSPVTKVLYLIG